MVRCGLPGPRARRPIYPAFWLQPRPAPPYYPNLVALSRNDEVIQRVAAAKIAASLPGGIAVKDSFDRLDLTKAGFQPLFDAQWIWLEAASRDAETPGTAIAWRRIASGIELARWEVAWAMTSPTGSRVFTNPLLVDPQVTILGAMEGDAVVAGCIAIRSANVLGFGNFLAPLGAVPGECRGRAGGPCRHLGRDLTGR